MDLAAHAPARRVMSALVGRRSLPPSSPTSTHPANTSPSRRPGLRAGDDEDDDDDFHRVLGSAAARRSPAGSHGRPSRPQSSVHPRVRDPLMESSSRAVLPSSSLSPTTRPTTPSLPRLALPVAAHAHATAVDLIPPVSVVVDSTPRGEDSARREPRRSATAWTVERGPSEGALRRRWLAVDSIVSEAHARLDEQRGRAQGHIERLRMQRAAAARADDSARVEVLRRSIGVTVAGLRSAALRHRVGVFLGTEVAIEADAFVEAARRARADGVAPITALETLDDIFGADEEALRRVERGDLVLWARVLQEAIGAMAHALRMRSAHENADTAELAHTFHALARGSDELFLRVESDLHEAHEETLRLLWETTQRQITQLRHEVKDRKALLELLQRRALSGSPDSAAESMLADARDGDGDGDGTALGADRGETGANGSASSLALRTRVLQSLAERFYLALHRVGQAIGVQRTTFADAVFLANAGRSNATGSNPGSNPTSGPVASASVTPSSATATSNPSSAPSVVDVSSVTLAVPSFVAEDERGAGHEGAQAMMAVDSEVLERGKRLFARHPLAHPLEGPGATATDLQRLVSETDVGAMLLVAFVRASALMRVETRLRESEATARRLRDQLAEAEALTRQLRARVADHEEERARLQRVVSDFETELRRLRAENEGLGGGGRGRGTPGGAASVPIEPLREFRRVLESQASGFTPKELVWLESVQRRVRARFRERHPGTDSARDPDANPAPTSARARGRSHPRDAPRTRGRRRGDDDRVAAIGGLKREEAPGSLAAGAQLTGRSAEEAIEPMLTARTVESEAEEPVTRRFSIGGHELEELRRIETLLENVHEMRRKERAKEKEKELERAKEKELERAKETREEEAEKGRTLGHQTDSMSSAEAERGDGMGAAAAAAVAAAEAMASAIAADAAAKAKTAEDAHARERERLEQELRELRVSVAKLEESLAIERLNGARDAAEHAAQQRRWKEDVAAARAAVPPLTPGRPTSSPRSLPSAPSTVSSSSQFVESSAPAGDGGDTKAPELPSPAASASATRGRHRSTGSRSSSNILAQHASFGTERPPSALQLDGGPPAGAIAPASESEVHFASHSASPASDSRPRSPLHLPDLPALSGPPRPTTAHSVDLHSSIPSPLVRPVVDRTARRPTVRSVGVDTSDLESGLGSGVRRPASRMHDRHAFLVSPGANSQPPHDAPSSSPSSSASTLHWAPVTSPLNFELPMLAPAALVSAVAAAKAAASGPGGAGAGATGTPFAHPVGLAPLSLLAEAGLGRGRASQRPATAMGLGYRPASPAATAAAIAAAATSKAAIVAPASQHPESSRAGMGEDAARRSPSPLSRERLEELSKARLAGPPPVATATVESAWEEVVRTGDWSSSSRRRHAVRRAEQAVAEIHAMRSPVRSRKPVGSNKSTTHIDTRGRTDRVAPQVTDAPPGPSGPLRSLWPALHSHTSLVLMGSQPALGEEGSVGQWTTEDDSARGRG